MNNSTLYTTTQAFDVRLTPDPLDLLFQQAVQAHQSGRWDEATKNYEKILSTQPDYSDALHLLALIRAEQQQWEPALALIDRAIMLSPGNPVFYINRAQMQRRLQHWELAIQDYHQAIQVAPRRAETYVALGDVYQLCERNQEAILQYLYACYLNPQQPPTTHHQLGNALLACGHSDSAILAYEKAIALNPRSAESLSNLGVVYAGMNRLDQAIAYHGQALAVNPNYGDAYINLGLALSQQEQFAEAEAAYQQALRLKPDQSAVIHSNRGLNQQAQGDWTSALASFNQALSLNPQNAKAQFNRAILLLRLGDYIQGWRDYEVRFQLNDPNHPLLKTTQPLWQDQDLAGRRLLVYAEQGLGDTLQCVRYLPLLQQRGACLIVQLQSALLPLLKSQSQWQGIEWVAASNVPASFDYHIPLMSLPQRFQTTVDMIPTPQSYLQVLPSVQSRLPQTTQSLRVGLVWAGNPQHKNDHRRSLPLSTLKPLLEVSGVDFFSLQYGPPSQEIRMLGLANRLIDLSPQLQDWQDSAQILLELDLLITVDTTIAHLSGALGKPAWVLLPFMADFRWLLAREDSPWYASLRLFRQKKSNDWLSVISEVRSALMEKIL